MTEVIIMQKTKLSEHKKIGDILHILGVCDDYQLIEAIGDIASLASAVTVTS